ncbi:hypothetical protein FRB90_002580 [Tulasnella sp. 427]|nr:hypothetical protein FRB90_002580 [Tulasnella sp. 427]
MTTQQLQQQQNQTDADVVSQPRTFERLMGDTELSYYLPSRADGANDMSLCIGFNGPRHLFTPRRVLATWALLLLRHPQLAQRVIPPQSNGSPFETDYSAAKLFFAAPNSPTDVLRKAASLVTFETDASMEELADRYLNGKRLLSETQLTRCIFSQFTSSPEQKDGEFVMFLAATHFVSDSVGFHRMYNEFFTIIAGQEMGYRLSAMDLEDLVRKEWQTRWGSSFSADVVLPSSLEDSLPPAGPLLKRTARKVDFMNSLKKQIGGYALPRTKGANRKGTVQSMRLDEFKTRIVLKNCKKQGVSVSNALFALAAIAWSRTQLARGNELRADLPIMMYTALNIRPYLPPVDTSYWFTAIGFFNVILPSFLPSSARSGDQASWKPLRSTFWHRSRSAKAQSIRAARNPMVPSRAREMARQRSEIAQAFAVEDDARDLGLPLPPPQPQLQSAPSVPSTAPSTALLGLSHLGDLDKILIQKDYPAVRLHTCTPGIRIRPGGLLVFAMTLAGKLSLHLVYDMNGFKDKIVEAWWADVIEGFEEFLVGRPASRL